MQTVTIQLLLKDRLLQEVPFGAEALSIGRMKENDVVINNLSVSRFHAVLHREGDAFSLEDKGSENGTYVNGERIRGRRPITAGDEIRVGKHKLLLCTGTGEIAPVAASGARTGDGWGAAVETYFAGPETQARMEVPAPPDSQFLVAEQAVLTSGDADVSTQSRGPLTEDPGNEIDPSGDFAIAEDEISLDGAADAEKLEVPELEGEAIEANELEVGEVEAELVSEALDAEPLDTASDPLRVDALGAVSSTDGAEAAVPPEPGEQTSFFSFGTDAEADPLGAELDPIGEPFTEQLPSAGLSSEPADAPEAGYAGLIIQRHGQLERVLSWDQDELRVGRAAECEVFLGAPEISRRHALFVRDGGRFEIQDLDSINGIFVNGERVHSMTLTVGDVVRIEDFELTFVLDQQPVGSEVQTREPTTDERSSADPFNMTRLHGEVTANPALGIGLAAREVELLGEEDAIDFSFSHASLEPEKPLSLEPRFEPQAARPEAVESLAPTALDLPAPPAEAGAALDLRIVVRREALPEPLRNALAELGTGELRIPVELCIAPAGEGDD